MKTKHAIVIVAIWSWMALGLSYAAIYSRIIYDLCLSYNHMIGIHPYEGMESYTHRQNAFLTEIFIALTEGTTALNAILCVKAWADKKDESPSPGILVFAITPLVLLVIMLTH